MMVDKRINKNRVRGGINGNNNNIIEVSELSPVQKDVTES